MRLIDADELLDILGAIHNKIGAGFDYKRIMQEIRQRARHNNVKAIPVEWIDKYENTEWEGDELVFTKMIRKWEKENEAN